MTFARIWLVALAMLTLATGTQAADVRTVHVHFARGASSAEVTGHIAGRETVHYLLRLRAGQMLRVELHAGSGAVAFNVFEPGHVPGRDGALYIGETGGPQMEVRTAHDGEYLIQVFQNRAAARRGERASYRLEVTTTGDAPAAAPAPAASAPQWQSLDGARAGQGEMALQRMGFELSRREGLTSFWNHAASMTCLRVVTSDGRYAVTQVPFQPNCPL